LIPIADGKWSIGISVESFKGPKSTNKSGIMEYWEDGIMGYKSNPNIPLFQYSNKLLILPQGCDNEDSN
jgi:hypothetical protein